MHRVAQLVAHVRARVDVAEEAFAARVLAPDALRLFVEMPVADRRHGLDVAEKLIGMGIDDRDLLSAALLHDAGKGHRLGLVHRVAGVLLDALAPSLLRRLARRDPSAAGHPFHLYLHHEAISADLVDAAGCPPRVGIFIRGTADGTDARLQRALKVADDAS